MSKGGHWISGAINPAHKGALHRGGATVLEIQAVGGGPGGAICPDEPAKVIGESYETYRDRVEAWRKEEQAKVVAAHAEDEAALFAQHDEFPARLPGETDEAFIARIDAWRKRRAERAS